MHPDPVVFTLQGDGDMVNEGLQEVLHTAARGEPVTCVLLNNGVFGETGGHMTATTVLGQRTKNTLDGRDAELSRLPDPHRGPDLPARGRGVRRPRLGAQRRRGGADQEDGPPGPRVSRPAGRGSRSSRSSPCARPAGSSRPPRAPSTCHDTLGEVHVMGELKVDGRDPHHRRAARRERRPPTEMEHASPPAGLDD